MAVTARIADLDITTIAELGTAIGTLVLAIATFGATRSANRSARVADRSLLLGLRPTLVLSRPEDPGERVDFSAGDRVLELPGGSAAVLFEDGQSLFAIALCNVGAGPAVMQGWHVRSGAPAQTRLTPISASSGLSGETSTSRPATPASGRVPSARSPIPSTRRFVRRSTHDMFTVHLLYSDQEGGQHFVSGFALRREGDRDHWGVAAGRHWALDWEAASFAWGHRV